MQVMHGAVTCPPFGPAELFKFIPDEFVRKNLAALGNCSLRCSTTFADRDVAVRRPDARAMQAQLAAFAIFTLLLFTWM